MFILVKNVNLDTWNKNFIKSIFEAKIFQREIIKMKNPILCNTWAFIKSV